MCKIRTGYWGEVWRSGAHLLRNIKFCRGMGGRAGEGRFYAGGGGGEGAWEGGSILIIPFSRKELMSLGLDSLALAHGNAQLPILV